jgi:ActR/RegA family two-component response regulator
LEASGNHIVMTDDDSAFVDTMARTMRREGYNVHTANDAETGFKLLQKSEAPRYYAGLVHGWLLFKKLKLMKI